VYYVATMARKRVYLDSIRSTHNVGSIFRTADGAGVEHIYLGGYTPAPRDRFGRLRPDIAKTSLSATESVPWELIESETVAVATLKQLQTEGWSVVAIEQAATAQSLYEFTVPEQVVYLFGNEVDGVSDNLLDLADVIVELPMLGQKESLNVSVTAGIVLYQR
jgi:tRNA G18 (ribose-2'-O)-methylase SpoU